ncbi:MAG: LacI family DNA-binding transcriptional regulator, partial [Ktedonobacteraceae bacterium]|nr:LacI family DNA-binding transcriptional regulator [Ktedonobacteraceae bacterium]
MINRRHKITIRDVAQVAGVSYQTVSRVINESDNVTEETRKRVLQAMHKLDYSPNKVARMLTTNRSQTLELIIVDVLHGGRLADSVKNMAHVAKECGYRLLISEASSDTLGEAFSNAASLLVDGIIMYAPRLQITDEKLRELSLGIPLVRRDYVPHSKLAWVGFDQGYATRIAVEHLIALGHRQIAAIPPSRELINGYWRYTVWESVLREYGLEAGPSSAGDYSIHSAYKAMNQIFETNMPFTALLVGTDTMALGAMRAIRERGRRIPDDISVISFDNAE